MTKRNLSSDEPEVEMADSGELLLVTHDGAFQADEVLAYTMLQFVFKGARLVRTRDLSQFDGRDERHAAKRRRDGDGEEDGKIPLPNEHIFGLRTIFFDVGGKYDPDNGVFDHHYDAPDKPHYMFANGTRAQAPMSSAGLVFSQFRREIVLAVLKEASLRYGLRLDEAKNKADEDDAWLVDLCDAVYSRFIHEVDAVDEGIFNDYLQMSLADAHEANENVAMSGEKYKMFTHVPSLVSLANNLAPARYSDQGPEYVFKLCASLVRNAFCLCVASLAARKMEQSEQEAIYFELVNSTRGPWKRDLCVYRQPYCRYTFDYRCRYHIYKDVAGKGCVRSHFEKLPDLEDVADKDEQAWIHHNRFLAKFSTEAGFEAYLTKLLVALQNSPEGDQRYSVMDALALVEHAEKVARRVDKPIEGMAKKNGEAESKEGSDAAENLQDENGETEEDDKDEKDEKEECRRDEEAEKTETDKNDQAISKMSKQCVGPADDYVSIKDLVRLVF